MPMTPTQVKKPISRIALRLFTNKLNVKEKTSSCLFGAAKLKHKAFKAGTTL